ncbi:MAG: AtpZ/AtpI family protein [Ruthenibacterium lactatiformans]
MPREEKRLVFRFAEPVLADAVGLSLAAPPVLCLLGAGWLARRLSLGPWVYFAAIVLGLGAAACTFAEFVKMFRRKNGKK